MRPDNKEPRPGDLFLDRYMPDATEAEREEAYQNLRGLIAVLVEIDDRLTNDRAQEIRANRDRELDSGIPA